MKLGKFSLGVGDRFSHQGKAQLKAIMRASEMGVDITPVWNKSNREHMYIGTTPVDTRSEADDAVKDLNYKGPYFVDADHINLSTVGPFVAVSDFFTLDVASFIGNESSKKEIDAFILSCNKYIGELQIPGLDSTITVTKELLEKIAHKFLAAIDAASEIYIYIKDEKGEGNFITEVSMDEVEFPQSPVEMLFIMKMIANKGIPIQTIAPKFTGRFNKGVEYVGNIEQFAKEFEEDVLIIDFAIKEFGLPKNLKLSVHSGSDKFSIYPIMAGIIEKYNKGIHVKTAGTTWLEEVIGLALAGGDGLEAAKKIYETSINRKEELCAPYADVIDIDSSKLPTIEEVNGWSSEKYANTLRHISTHPDYNPNFRQLIHVAYAIAAEMGQDYYSLLEKHSDIIGLCVEENIYDRHLKRLFDI